MTSGEDKQVPEQADSSAQHVLFAFITLLSDRGKMTNVTNKQRSEVYLCHCVFECLLSISLGCVMHIIGLLQLSKS